MLPLLNSGYRLIKSGFIFFQWLFLIYSGVLSYSLDESSTICCSSGPNTNRESTIVSLSSSLLMNFSRSNFFFLLVSDFRSLLDDSDTRKPEFPSEPKQIKRLVKLWEFLLWDYLPSFCSCDLVSICKVWWFLLSVDASGCKAVWCISTIFQKYNYSNS